MEHHEIHDLALVATKTFLDLYEHDFEDADFAHIVHVARNRYLDAVEELERLENGDKDHVDGATDDDDAEAKDPKDKPA